MRKKLLPILLGIGSMVMSTVAIVSVTLWAAAQINKNINADGSVTVIIDYEDDITDKEDEIIGNMSMGIQIYDKGGLTNTVKFTSQDIRQISSIDIGDLTITIQDGKTGYINIWFEITNLSDSSLNIVTLLFGGEDGEAWETLTNVPAAKIFSAATSTDKLEASANLLDKINNAESKDMNEDYSFADWKDNGLTAGESYSVSQYYAYYYIENQNTAVIQQNETVTVVVRYLISAATDGALPTAIHLTIS